MVFPLCLYTIANLITIQATLLCNILFITEVFKTHYIFFVIHSNLYSSKFLSIQCCIKYNAICEFIYEAYKFTPCNILFPFLALTVLHKSFLYRTSYLCFNLYQVFIMHVNRGFPTVFKRHTFVQFSVVLLVIILFIHS